MRQSQPVGWPDNEEISHQLTELVPARAPAVVIVLVARPRRVLARAIFVVAGPALAAGAGPGRPDDPDTPSSGPGASLERDAASGAAAAFAADGFRLSRLWMNSRAEDPRRAGAAAGVPSTAPSSTGSTPSSIAPGAAASTTSSSLDEVLLFVWRPKDGRFDQEMDGIRSRVSRMLPKVGRGSFDVTLACGCCFCCLCNPGSIQGETGLVRAQPA